LAGTRAADLIAIVNEFDEQIGAMPKAELASPRGIHFRTSHVFLFTRNRKLLLQQLAPQRDRNPLKWGSSVAAYVHAGESYLDAARRRTREELGLRIPLDLIGKTEMPDLGGVKHISLFAGTVEQQYLRVLEPDHIAHVEWFPIPAVQHQVTVEPERFTETFLYLFTHFYNDDQLRNTSTA
jgi:isopentenyl-diphosphate delta-isomerase